jgi:hypothetical protein
MVAANLAMRWSLSDTWNNAGFLEVASALSTIILIVGAVIEEWPTLKKIGLLLAKYILIRSTQFERCVLRKLFAHSLGAILVVVGIAGELIFETRTFIVEDRETATLSTKAGDAKKSADDAAAAAKRAEGSATAANSESGEAKTKAEVADVASGEAVKKSNEANTVASNASLLAQQVGNDAKQLRADIEKATKAQLELRKNIEQVQHEANPRWRNLVEQRDAIALALKGKPVSKFEILYASEDDEAYMFAAVLHGILLGNGWTSSGFRPLEENDALRSREATHNEPLDMRSSASWGTGISINVKNLPPSPIFSHADDSATSALIMALGGGSVVTDPRLPDDVVRIVIEKRR